MDIKFIMASEILGIIKNSDLVKLATDSLAIPINEDLLNLSLCDPNDDASISRYKSDLYRNSDLPTMSTRDALEYYAKITCQDILSGSIEPIDGAKKIARVAINVYNEDYHLMDPFIYIYSEVDYRSSDMDFFIEATKREAEIFISKLK